MTDNVHDVANMQALARALDKLLNGSGPKKNGFVLLTFEFGNAGQGAVNYVSNANRDDMIATMKELIARFEGRYVEGSADSNSLKN